VSTALAVCHGSFGRVTVYRLDKPMRMHAHREGHLTFLLNGAPAIVTIDGIPHLVDRSAGVAINPWQPHSFQPTLPDQPSVFLVAYICDRWLDRDQEGRGSLRFGSNAVRVGTTLLSICASLAHVLVTNASYRIVNRYLNQLFDACFDESWRSGRLRRGGGMPRSTSACANRFASWTVVSARPSNSTRWRATQDFPDHTSSSSSAKIPG
jgi:hypothetical protein